MLTRKSINYNVLRKKGAKISTSTQGAIHLWSEDVFWLPRIQDAARAAGYTLSVLQDPAEIGASTKYVQRRIPLTEPLEGPDAQLVRHLTETRPALIIIDLNSQAIPWARWIQVIKTSAATRRIPILAFGPHIDNESMKAAENAGAESVISRGKFQASLHKLLAQWARPPIDDELLSACSGELSERAMQGIRLHNEMDFYEAHEELELAWMDAPEHEGYLYRALLQTTVAYLHLRRSNLRGAAKMLLRVRQWLDPLPDNCRGVDIDHLRSTVDRLRTVVEASNSETELPALEDLFRPFKLLG